MDPTLLWFGTAVSKLVVRFWFADNPAARSGAIEVTDLLKTRISGLLEHRRAARQLEMVAEEVAAKLEPLIQSEFSALGDNERTAAMLTVTEVLENYQIEPRAIISTDFDAELFEKHIRLQHPSAAEKAYLSDAATALYDLLLREACNYIVDIVTTLPQFGSVALQELLKRESEIIRLVKKVLASLPEVSDSTVGQEDGQFEIQYKRTLLRKVDRLELFGLTVSDVSRRYALSVAYISLSATTELIEEGEESDEPTQGGLPDSSATAHPKGVIPLASEDVSYIRVEDVLTRSRRTLIRGEAGSGKTTLLQWLAIGSSRGSFEGALQEWNDSVPFFVPLRRYAKSEFPPPERFLEHTARTLVGTMPQGWVHKQLNSGRALVLIDGLDELPEEQRPSAREWLSELSASYPEARYVVTSRPPAVSEGWLTELQFREAELQPMSLPDISAFVDHWHQAAKMGIGDGDETHNLDRFRVALKTVVRENRVLRSLATSPLLCAMLCALNRDRRTQLPRDRMELYRIALETLLERRDVEREVPASTVHLNLREKRLLLQDFAYWLLLNNQTDSDFESARQRLGLKLQGMPHVTAPSSHVFKFLLERSGLLRVPVEDRVDFIHRTFQEYLAAAEIVEQDNIEFLLSNAHDDGWKEVVVLAAGHASLARRQNLIQGLLDRGTQERQLRHRLHLLAVACLETSSELSKDLTEKLRRTLTQLIPPENMSEAKSLASAGDLATPLLGEHRRKRVSIAAASIRTLALIGTPMALETLALFGKDQRKTVQKELLRSWSSFDTWDFAQLVLAETPLENGHLEISELDWLRGIHHMRKLQSISIFLRESGERMAELETPDMVVELFASGNQRLESLDFLSQMPRLQKLNVSHCTKLEDYEPIRLLKSLREFDAAGANSGLDIEFIRPLSELKALQLDGWTPLSDLTPLSNLSSLRYLSLRRCTNLQTLSGLEGTESLIWLDLTGCESLRDVEALTRHADLEELSFRGCIGLESIRPITGCENLAVLDLHGCSSADLTGISLLSRLVALCINGNRRLENLRELPEAVQVLHLDDCPSLVDVSAVSSCGNLHNLSLERCSSIVDVAPLASLRTLQNLSVSGCPWVKDLSFITSGEQLLSLSLRSCWALEDASELSSCESLYILDLTECHHLRALPPLPDSLNALSVAGCTDLSSLNSVIDLPNLRSLVIDTKQADAFATSLKTETTRVFVVEDTRHASLLIDRYIPLWIRRPIGWVRYVPIANEKRQLPSRLFPGARFRRVRPRRGNRP
jgi:hypothetical protein